MPDNTEKPFIPLDERWIESGKEIAEKRKYRLTDLLKQPITFDADITYKPMPRTVEYSGRMPEELRGNEPPDSISAVCELDGVKYSGTLYRDDRYTTPKKAEYK